ncbi:MAG TPA: hypothetical protein VK789_18320 [Bryobacteraceae bacterium]|nr:hypothetical protein [Bryobacteraceae bacterium]
MIGFDDLKELAAIQGPCLSIFQPLRDEFSQVTKADTRLTAAAQKADALLEKKIFDSAARQEFLSPIFKLAHNTDWNGRTGSMVIFRAPGFTKASFWPDTLDSRIYAADEFLLLPLLPGLAAQRRFWILTLSIKRIRLFRGTEEGFSEAPLPKDLPLSLAEAGAFDQPDHDLESRSSPTGATGQIAAIRSGTTTANETQGQYLHDFFKKIDRAIHPILGGKSDPLILAAVGRELAIYREINTYPALIDEAIQGSPEPIVEDKLRKAAMELLAARSGRVAEGIRREMDRAAGRGLLTMDLDAIEAAARIGQIDTLFVEPKPTSNEDRINEAALAVIHNSGTVAACESLETSVAAILRYRVPAAPQPEVAASQV